MVQAYNKKYVNASAKELRNDQNIFQSFPVYTDALFERHSVKIKTRDALPTSFQDFELMFPQGDHVGDLLDKTSVFNNLKSLKEKTVDTAQNLISGLHDQNKHLVAQTEEYKVSVSVTYKSENNIGNTGVVLPQTATVGGNARLVDLSNSRDN